VIGDLAAVCPWGRPPPGLAAILSRLEEGVPRTLKTSPARRGGGCRKRRKLDRDFREGARAAPVANSAVHAGHWSTGKVGPEIHIKGGNAPYSVPWRLVGERVDARETWTTVQSFHNGQLPARTVAPIRGAGAPTWPLPAGEARVCDAAPDLMPAPGRRDRAGLPSGNRDATGVGTLYGLRSAQGCRGPLLQDQPPATSPAATPTRPGRNASPNSSAPPCSYSTTWQCTSTPTIRPTTLRADLRTVPGRPVADHNVHPAPARLVPAVPQPRRGRVAARPAHQHQPPGFMNEPS
jgi:hypothetical protein